MEELHRVADKLFTEVDHLERILEGEDLPDSERTELALSVAKRVRRDSTLLVRHLASLRDNQL
jgi:hypothetical protein